MEKDKYKTDVIFRVDTKLEPKGTIFALMPHQCCDHEGHIDTYQHVGQHSTANYRYCVSISRLATPEEYKDLKEEMESLGYDLRVIKKQNRDKYLKSYYEVRGIKK